MAAPTVGEIVHHTDYDPDVCIAAIVTAVNPDGTLNIHIFSPNGGQAGIPNVPESTTTPRALISWHRPEAVA